VPLSETITNDNAELNINGILTFKDSVEFRKRLEHIFASNVKTLAVSLSGLTFMDSSGLGMLLVVSNECEKRGVALSILHPQGEVKTLLQMTRSYERLHIVD